MDETIPSPSDHVTLGEEFRVYVMDHKRGKVFVVTQRVTYSDYLYRRGPLDEYRMYERERFDHQLYRALIDHDALYDVSIGRLEVRSFTTSIYDFTERKSIDEQVREAIADGT